VIKDASGRYRGVAIDLGSALAQKLGVPVEFVPANAAGVRIAGAGTATFRASNKASPKATHVEVASVAAAVDLMKAGKIDCIALSRESLTGLLPKILGAYILEGGFSILPPRLPCRTASRRGSPMSASSLRSQGWRPGAQGTRRHRTEVVAVRASRAETLAPRRCGRILPNKMTSAMGSKADKPTSPRNVRFSPESGH
jgi:hypothetical protein